MSPSSISLFPKILHPLWLVICPAIPSSINPENSLVEIRGTRCFSRILSKLEDAFTSFHNFHVTMTFPKFLGGREPRISMKLSYQWCRRGDKALINFVTGFTTLLPPRVDQNVKIGRSFPTITFPRTFLPPLGASIRSEMPEESRCSRVTIDLSVAGEKIPKPSTRVWLRTRISIPIYRTVAPHLHENGEKLSPEYLGQGQKQFRIPFIDQSPCPIVLRLLLIFLSCYLGSSTMSFVEDSCVVRPFKRGISNEEYLIIEQQGVRLERKRVERIENSERIVVIKETIGYKNGGWINIRRILCSVF